MYDEDNSQLLSESVITQKLIVIIQYELHMATHQLSATCLINKVLIKIKLVTFHSIDHSI